MLGSQVFGTIPSSYLLLIHQNSRMKPVANGVDSMGRLFSQTLAFCPLPQPRTFHPPLSQRPKPGLPVSFLLSGRKKKKKKYPTSPDTSSQGGLSCVPLAGDLLLRTSLLPLHCRPSRKTSSPLSATGLHPHHFQMPLPRSLAEPLMQTPQQYPGLHLARLPAFNRYSKIPSSGSPVPPLLTSWQAWRVGEESLLQPSQQLSHSSPCVLGKWPLSKTPLCVRGYCSLC